MKKKALLVVHSFFLLACYLLVTKSEEVRVQGKEEAIVPLTTLAPPEGNTTFSGGTTWCVALSGVSQIDLQIALDWACGTGNTDCTQIQAGGACFEPDTLQSHASYAFNSYYQQNGNNEVACNFGGTATVTKHDPSYGKCVYDASRPTSSAPEKFAAHTIFCITWLILCLTKWLFA